MAKVIGERIGQLMRERGFTQASLAAAIGVTQPTIGRLISGESRETARLLELAKALAVQAEFLTGEDDEPFDLRDADTVVEGRIELKRRAGLLTPAQRAARAKAEAEARADVIEIDQVDLRYGMGGAYVEGHVPVEKRQFSRAWLRQLTSVAPEHLAWTKGDGDSMEPTIRSDEVVLVDRSKTTPGMDDKIWVCAVGEVGMIKRLRALPSGVVEIHSDNPHVPMATAVDGELHVIGRVIAVVRRL